MVLTFDGGRQRSATWRGMKGDPAGRTGIVAAVALCVGAPIAASICGAALSAAWGDSWDYDGGVVLAVAVTVAVMFLIAGFVVFRLAWRNHSSGNGLRRDQLLAVDRGWLTYSFRVTGDVHVGMRTVIVIQLAPPLTTVTLEADRGRVRFDGNVWRYLDLDISNPGTNLFLVDGTQLMPTFGAVPPVDQLEKISGFFIPDSFVPDLYQTALSNFA